jgi:hypothetical protein
LVPALHHLHHLLHLLELLQQLVHVHDLDAGPVRDALPRLPLSRSGLRRSWTVIDLMIASVRAIWRSAPSPSWTPLIPGHHPEDALHRAHLLDLLQLRQEVLEVEVGLAQLLGHPLGLVLVDRLLAFSTSDTTSPIPRMREASRSG